MQDLERLVRPVSRSGGEVTGLATPRYRQEYAAYRSELARLAVNERRARQEITRVAAMVVRDFAPRQELEDKEMDLARVLAERQATVDRTMSEWQAALVSTRTALLRRTDLQQECRDLPRAATRAIVQF